jgi:glucose-1-phosphate cytidylyltransferase
MNSDFTVKLGSQDQIKRHGVLEEAGWQVTVADTGAATMTGGRIFKVRDHVGKDTFLCTYGDGLADINISRLLDFHKSHGKIATLTAVRPVSRFGVLDLSPDGLVESFQEKPQAAGWINAGYFVFEPKIFDYLEPNSILEREPMANLAKDGQLVAFKHEGFFQPMDTYREMSMLNEMWAANKAPWKLWK